MYFWCKLKQQFSARSILKPLDPVMKENDCIEQYSFVLAYSECVAISFSVPSTVYYSAGRRQINDIILILHRKQGLYSLMFLIFHSTSVSKDLNSTDWNLRWKKKKTHTHTHTKKQKKKNNKKNHTHKKRPYRSFDSPFSVFNSTVARYTFYTTLYRFV